MRIGVKNIPSLSRKMKGFIMLLSAKVSKAIILLD